MLYWFVLANLPQQKMLWFALFYCQKYSTKLFILNVMSQPHSTKQSVPGIAVTFEEGPSAAVSADSEGKEEESSEKEPESSQRCCCCFDVHVKVSGILILTQIQ
jgi:hypothetical protein